MKHKPAGQLGSVTCHMSHVTCHMSHASRCPRDFRDHSEVHIDPAPISKNLYQLIKQVGDGNGKGEILLIDLIVKANLTG